jgi:predicted NBD/HSP70 family sugar kinase
MKLLNACERRQMTQDPPVVAPQSWDRPQDGAGPSWLRDRNERLVLSTVRDNGPIASAEIARMTSLSAQTASVITRSLEADGLLLRGAPQRGKVGKPSVPVTLNPSGALAYGLRIGRRGAALVLMDIVGGVRAQRTITYPYPTPELVHAFMKAGVEEITGQIDAATARSIIGIGVAAPFELWNWLDVVGAPKEEMLRWQEYDFPTAFATFTPLPVIVANDATMACNGEFVFGVGAELQEFLYFYIGAFIGGGLVMNGAVHFGRNGNAGAFGSILVGDASSHGQQLIHNASIFTLEAELQAVFKRPFSLWGQSEDWNSHPEIVRNWCARTAKAMARAIVSAVAVVDIQTVVVDGGMPEPIKATIVEMITEALARTESEGIVLPSVLAGKLGISAGALGAAYQPIKTAHFL